MTRVTVDANTTAKLEGLDRFLEIYDEAGNLLGRFEPSEKSPLVQAWLAEMESDLTEEEIERRIANARINGLTTEQVIERLTGRKP